MRPWLTRGLGMAVLHGAADTALAKAMVYNPTGLVTVKIVVIALLVGVAALWGALDGWFGREDAGRAWVIGAIFAGLGSGALYVIGRGIFVDQSGAETIWPALTGGAAFTALLVLVPAGLGVAVGGRLTHPEPAEKAGKAASSESADDEPPPAKAVRKRTPSPSPRRRQTATKRPVPARTAVKRPSPSPRSE